MKQISGIWTDARGNPASFGKLYAYLNQDAVAVAQNQIVPKQVSFQLDQLGRLRADAQIWSNDELSPETTYYRFAVLDFGGGLVWGPEFVILSGTAPIDFNSLVPTGGMPPVFTVASEVFYEADFIPLTRGFLGISPGHRKRHHRALCYGPYREL